MAGKGKPLTVTGYPSYNPCRVDNSTSTPAA